MTPWKCSSASDFRRLGMALVVIPVLVILIALGAYRFSFYMESQYRLTRLDEEMVHARSAALSGFEFVAALIELPPELRAGLGSLTDNAGLFQHIAIRASDGIAQPNGASNDWRFSLVSANRFVEPNSEPIEASRASGGTSQSLRFGLENESAKLHIPTLLAWEKNRPGHAFAALARLPGANEATIHAWLKKMGVKASGGARGLGEVEGQDRMPLSNELPAWFGGDLNQNYQLDPLELRLQSQRRGQGVSASVAALDGADTATGLFPLQRYLTWHGGHRNLTREGRLRIFLNNPQLRNLHSQLITIWPAERANFVIAMRQYGPRAGDKTATATSPPSTATASESTVGADWVPDFGRPATYVFQSPLDLVGAAVELPGIASAGKQTTKQLLRSPFSSDLAETHNYLGRLLDEVTVDVAPVSVGRVDVAEAPLEVLAGIPGLDIGMANHIVQQRTTSERAVASTDTIAWLLDVMDVAKLRELEPYLTCRSDVYSVQSIGYRDNSSAVYRATATIDARQIPARIRSYKIWHPWDRGFAIEQLSNKAL